MRIDWKGALGIALSVLLLWWTLHDAPLGDVARVLAASNWGLFALSTITATLIFPLRARRWRTILDPVAPHVAFGPLWRATAIGMMVNNVVPARAGEFARAYALKREVPRVPFAAAIASLAVDRVFDAIVLLLLMVVAPLDPRFPAGVRIYGQSVPALARGLVLLTVALLVVLYAIVVAPDRFARIFARVARRVAPRFEARGVGALTAFADGLAVLRQPGRFLAVFWWALLHWLLCAFSVWLGFRAVGITAPFSAALLLNSLQSVASAIPSSPGFFGVFESVSKAGLQIYGVPATRAVSWALGYHILTFIPITVIGLVYLTRLGLTLGQVASGGGPDDPDAPQERSSATSPSTTQTATRAVALDVPRG